MAKKKKIVNKIKSSEDIDEIFSAGIYRHSEIAYDKSDSDDRHGYIKGLFEGYSFEEYKRYLEKTGQEDTGYSCECYINLLKKVKSEKKNKPLKLSKFEREVLEKALDISFKYCSGIETELTNLRYDLAWANTAFLNKENSYEKNLREAGRRLEFTKSKYVHPKSMEEFIALFRGKKKLGKKLALSQSKVMAYYNKALNGGKERKDRVDAVLKTQEEFDFASPDACARYLRKGLKNIPGFPP
jgi:hypothetical protein